MAIIIGDHKGTTFGDFLVLPGLPDDENLTPDSVNLRSKICEVEMGVPFYTAAMKSVTNQALAYAAGNRGMMGVVPRSIPSSEAADIVKYVKDRMVKPGNIEPKGEFPEIVRDDQFLGDAIKIAKEHGHSNVPVVKPYYSDFVGMFLYSPSEHDQMDLSTPIIDLMEPFKDKDGKIIMDVCYENMKDKEIEQYLEKEELRFVPVLDDIGRLRRLAFLQMIDAYKVGAAFDTHPGWEERIGMLIEAGVDMAFTDTSDLHKGYAIDLIKKYKNDYPKGPPICAGNIVTPEAFEYLADAGADAIKVGMGPGSICTTNQVLGVGAPPFWAVVEVCRKRDRYAEKKERYVPVIADGGIANTGDIAVALTHADGIMGGSIFACFEESAGIKIKEGDRKVVKIYGEASSEAFEATGDMNRYSSPLDSNSVSSFQGVSGTVPYKGRFKPGLESYMRTLKEALYHAGAEDMETYRKNAILVRLSERANQIASPHDIDVTNI